MRRSFFLIPLFLLLVTACASTPVIRYFPPQASIKELAQQTDQQYQTQIRIQNFSTGAMTFNRIQLKIRIQDGAWAEISAPETLQVGANTAELLTLTVPFDSDTRRIIHERQNQSQPLRYSLQGTIHSDEAGSRYRLQYEGRLNPAPGLNGVYR